MKKLIILIMCSMFLVCGCNKNTEVVIVKKINFYYQQEVQIISGFYKGYSGIVRSYNTYYSVVTPNDFNGRYDVEIFYVEKQTPNAFIDANRIVDVDEQDLQAKTPRVSPFVQI